MPVIAHAVQDNLCMVAWLCCFYIGEGMYDFREGEEVVLKLMNCGCN